MPPGHDPRPRILVIDDDAELCDLLAEYLGTEGYEIVAALRPEEGLDRAASGLFSLVLLDVTMPGMSGFDVLRRLRRTESVPVIMLTARGDPVDRVVGLELGADDYLAKPFDPRELLARVRAVLRRSAATERESEAEDDLLRAGDLELDRRSRRATCNGRFLELTGAEFALLELLMQEVGQVVPRETLYRRVLGRRLLPDDRTIDTHVSNLRRKLGPAPGAEETSRIRSVRGVGYALAIAEPH